MQTNARPSILRGAEKVPDPPKLYRRAINWSKDTKYLGVTLDSRLTYDKHITNINKKTRTAKARLYPLLGRKSKLSLKNKLLLYKTILRPIMTYASPVWGGGLQPPPEPRQNS
ncbi:hypothetical protein AVEN_265008-1 [Araneus ventricosus]|uniref:RNA-directed DNA polymerase from transposon X-element n=1 Tax=Araneus ventricosus TaxID=182803 RepID=A0A4Y2ERM3_ARAVE|nr:hypothetical protein AVEN_265008-1 [Araneus ventricosus]